MPETTSVGRSIEQAVERDEHAVGGRAVDAVHVRPVAVDAQRPVQRERLRGGALVAVGRHDAHAPERGELACAALAAPGDWMPSSLVTQDVHQDPFGPRIAAAARTSGATIMPTMRGTSRVMLRWLVSSPYTVGIGTSATRNPSRAARTAISVSTS